MSFSFENTNPSGVTLGVLGVKTLAYRIKKLTKYRLLLTHFSPVLHFYAP